MSPETVTVRRVIKDHILRNNQTSQPITFDSTLIKYVQSAAQRYRLTSEEKKKKQKIAGRLSGSSDDVKCKCI